MRARSRLLNEAPKPRLRRLGDGVAWDPPADISSMKLRSRDFGDVRIVVFRAAIADLSSMKLRSRDFGDVAHRVLVPFTDTQSSMKLRSRDFGDCQLGSMLTRI